MTLRHHTTGNVIAGPAVAIPRPDGAALAARFANADFGVLYQEPLIVPDTNVSYDTTGTPRFSYCGDSLSLWMSSGYARPPEPTLHGGLPGVWLSSIDWEATPRLLFAAGGWSTGSHTFAVHECDANLALVTVLEELPATYGVGTDVIDFAAAGDLDGDGADDIVATRSSPGTIFLSTMAFAPVPIAATGRVWLADIDSDGVLDIFADMGTPPGYDLVFHRQPPP